MKKFIVLLCIFYLSLHTFCNQQDWAHFNVKVYKWSEPCFLDNFHAATTTKTYSSDTTSYPKTGTTASDQLNSQTEYTSFTTQSERLTSSLETTIADEEAAKTTETRNEGDMKTSVETSFNSVLTTTTEKNDKTIISDLKQTTGTTDYNSQSAATDMSQTSENELEVTFISSTEPTYKETSVEVIFSTDILKSEETVPTSITSTVTLEPKSNTQQDFTTTMKKNYNTEEAINQSLKTKGGIRTNTKNDVSYEITTSNPFDNTVEQTTSIVPEGSSTSSAYETSKMTSIHNDKRSPSDLLTSSSIGTSTMSLMSSTNEYSTTSNDLTMKISSTSVNPSRESSISIPFSKDTQTATTSPDENSKASEVDISKSLSTKTSVTFSDDDYTSTKLNIPKDKSTQWSKRSTDETSPSFTIITLKDSPIDSSSESFTTNQILEHDTSPTSSKSTTELSSRTSTVVSSESSKKNIPTSLKTTKNEIDSGDSKEKLTTSTTISTKKITRKTESINTKKPATSSINTSPRKYKTEKARSTSNVKREKSSRDATNFGGATETTPITVTLLNRKTNSPVDVTLLMTTPILKEMMTDTPPECPNGMVVGNLYCYGVTSRNETFMEQMFGCKFQYGKMAKLVPEYALYDYQDRQLILNLTSKSETTKILIDPEGGPLLRENKLAIVRDLNEFPWRGIYSEHTKELVGIQEELHGVAGVCRLSKHNGLPDCSTGSLFTVFGLDKVVRMPKKNNTLYKTGSILAVHCRNPSTYVPVWNLKCMAGWWSPSPQEIECKIKRGTPYEPKPSGFYQPYVKDCSVCWDIGTANCTKIEDNDKYKCNCKPGFEGFHCEGIPQYCGNDSQAANFCNKHGRCYNNVTGAVCVCYYGWGGSHCSFDRRKFEWDRYGYYSGAQICSTFEAIILYIYVIYRIIDTKLNHEDTRLGTIKTARTWAELAYIIVFAMHRKPQLLGLSNATCDLFYTLTHGFALTVLLYYTSECLTYMGVKMCWHRNVWSNWDDRDLNTHRARNVVIYLGIPFYLGLLTPFFINLFIAGDYSLAEDWSCVGRLEHVHSRPVLAILVCGGFYMIIGSFIMWSADNFERESNDTKLKRHNWFIHFAPLEVEFTQKVTRQSFSLRWLPRLFFAQHVTGVLATTFPEWVGIDRTYVAISCIYSLIYTYQSLQSDSRRWKWLCTWLMLKLPKKFAPQFNPMTFMTRDETLAWKKPQLFWKEIRDEVVKEFEEEEKERKTLIEKRNRLIQNYPDLPANLLPHIPEPFDDKVPTLEEKIKARADEKLKYKPFEINHFNEFFPMYLQEVIQLNIIKNYVGDRLKRKGSMSVLDTVVHFGLIEYDYWKNLYVHCEDGKRSRVALEQLTAIVGETILSVKKNDWNRYRREHSNNVKKDKELRQRNPGLYHYLKDRKFVKPWFPYEVAMDDKADNLYKKLMEQISYRQCQGMPHVCEYGNMMQRFANIERARPNLYVSRFPYIRSLRTWNERLELQKFADEDANTNWEKIYENDTWFENLTDYQKEALRTEYKIYRPDKRGEYMNPRKLEQSDLFDSFWEWRKPTFIGPREKKCYAYLELGHPLCSHVKRWCEEADEFEFTNYIETQQAPFEMARADGQAYVDYEEVNRREEMHIPNPGDHGISPPDWALRYIKKRTRSPNKFH